MADHQELLERVRRLLEPERDVVEKRMFGSIGFMVGGVLRVGVGVGRKRDHVMMARVPLADEAEALRLPGVAPATMGGRTRHGWLFFEEAAVDSDEQLGRWVASALAAEA